MSIFNTPETKPEQPKNYNYNREISLIITYNQPDGEGHQYKQWQFIETDDVNDYSEKKEKVVKEKKQKSNKKETKVVIQEIKKNIELESTTSDTEIVIPKREVPTEINLDDIEF